MSAFAQYTTLIPFGLDEQLAKLEGWHKAHGGPVHTVNHSREYHVLAPQLPDWVIPVELRFVQKFGRDYVPLTSLFRAIEKTRPDTAERILIANADIEIADPSALEDLRDPDCDLLFASRNDIDAAGASAGLYRKGFDVFSLAPEALSMLDLEGVFLGLPWWDYVLPLNSILSGRSVRRLDLEAFHHRIHPQRWSLVGFNYIGWQFMRQVLPPSLCAGLPTDDRVMDFAKIANRFLNSAHFVDVPSPEPAQIRDAFLSEVEAASGVSDHDAGSASAQIERAARFADLHGALLELYLTSLDGRDADRVRTRLAELEQSAAAAGVAGQESYGRYARLVELRLGGGT